MLANSFRSGYSINHQTFSDVPIFPYREDNKPFLIDTYEFNREVLNSDVNFKFQFNEIKFNSKMNKLMLQELSGGKDLNHDKLEHILISDYVYSGRQYSIYVFDCQLLDCNGDLMQFIDKMS